MSDPKKPPVTVTFDHDPVTLRVDEMVAGEIQGSKVSKFIGDIPLVRGVNKIDADLWAKWLESNKDGPIAALIREEKNDGKTEEPAA